MYLPYKTIEKYIDKPRKNERAHQQWYVFLSMSFKFVWPQFNAMIGLFNRTDVLDRLVFFFFFPNCHCSWNCIYPTSFFVSIWIIRYGNGNSTLNWLTKLSVFVVDSDNNNNNNNSNNSKNFHLFFCFQLPE